MIEKSDNNNLINKAARDILTLARSLLIVRLRFLDIAIGRLKLIPADGKTYATDGNCIIYGPGHVVRSFRDENEKPARDYLHMVLHCIYSHMFVGSLESPELWDLACDIAVENTINDLGLDVTDSSVKAAQTAETSRLLNEVNMLTAEKLYSYFLAYLKLILQGSVHCSQPMITPAGMDVCLGKKLTAASAKILQSKKVLTMKTILLPSKCRYRRLEKSGKI